MKDQRLLRLMTKRVGVALRRPGHELQKERSDQQEAAGPETCPTGTILHARSVIIDLLLHRSSLLGPAGNTDMRATAPSLNEMLTTVR